MHLIKRLFSKSKSQKASPYLEFEEKTLESPEEFKAAHHRMALKEISKYENVDFNNFSDSQVKRIVKEIGLIIKTSLLKYPDTAECDTEVLEISRVLIKVTRFRLYFMDYLSDNYHEIIRQGTKIEWYYRTEMIYFLKWRGPNKLSPGVSLFHSIRQGTTPVSYLKDLLNCN